MFAEEYRKLAALEDRMWYFRALHARRLQWLARYFSGAPARIVDAGCGTGGFLRAAQAAQPAWQLSGLDLSPLACELARQRSTARIEQGSLTALPFADGACDAITTGDVLYHLDDVDAALREFARCLRPGGVVVLNEPAYRWLWSYHDIATEARHRFGRGELAQRVRDAGLAIEFSSHANAVVLPLVVARRKLLPPRAPSSDVALAPAAVERALAAVAALENALLGRGVPLPAGSSVFVVARRR